jgi:RHS repeat-associated protein
MSRRALAYLIGAVMGALIMRADSPSRRRRRAAHDLVTAGFLIVVTVMIPASAWAQSGQIVEYYHLDALGSVRVVTDQNAQVVARHDFLPFGEEWNPPANAKEKKLFTGHERDAETGLDYFGARYYRPQVGRFTTVDPGHASATVDDPQSWNAYAYARNNPLRFIDPTGTDYIVHTRGGTPFWFTGSWNEFQGFAQGFTLEGGPFSGTIYNAAGQEVGTYRYFDPFDRVLVDAGMRAGPPVNLVMNALRVFGYVVAPEILAAADCAADWAGCTKSGVMMAALSPKVLKLLGAIAPLAEQTVAQAIRLRGGGASQVNQIATYLQHVKLSEVARRAANGEAEAVKALKMVKQAAAKAQRY